MIIALITGEEKPEGRQTMDLGLTGKVVVVTGGSKGIGSAIVREFFKEGAVVATFGRTEKALRTFAEELAKEGYDLYFEALDASKKSEVSAFAQRVKERFGSIDVWVNNAGTNRLGRFLDYSEEDYDYIMDINTKSVFLCTQIAGSIMKEQGGGVIINASSFATHMAQANSTIYAASKCAVASFTKSTAGALAPFGIRVVGYMPGVILTPLAYDMIKSDPEKYYKDIAMHRTGDPEEIAKPVVFLASPCASFITGVDLEIGGGKFAVQDCMMAYNMEKEAQ